MRLEALLGCMLLLVGCASEKSTSTPQVDRSKRAIHLSGGIEVDRDRGEVRVPARVGIDTGWIEQVACVQGSRDHESLLIVTAQPSTVHAGLLLLGLEPGHPGYWRFADPNGESPKVQRVSPVGSRVGIFVQSADASGQPREQPISEWLETAQDGQSFPTQPWVFGGSVFDSEDVYAADRSGSLVGLVTFGDEVLGLESIMADQTGVDAAEWQARDAAMPSPGTEVTLIIRPWQESD